MTIDDVQYSDTPFSSLTELADQMLEKVADTDIKAIVFLSQDDPDEPDHTLGGIGMSGYEDASEGVADLLIHLKAMLSTEGKQLMLMTEEGFYLTDEVPHGQEHD